MKGGKENRRTVSAAERRVEGRGEEARTGEIRWRREGRRMSDGEEPKEGEGGLHQGWPDDSPAVGELAVPPHCRSYFGIGGSIRVVLERWKFLSRLDDVYFRHCVPSGVGH